MDSMIVWMWAGLSLEMLLLSVLAFSWAVRARQFSDSKKSARLPLKDKTKSLQTRE